MPPRSTLCLALCACLGLAGTAPAQFGPNGPQRPGREGMRQRFGSIITAPSKWAEYTIVSIAEEGKDVKKGDVVLALKSARFDAKLADLKFQQKSATADYEAAKLDRIVAELRQQEFREGIAPLEINQVSAEVAMADSESAASEANLAAARKQSRPEADLVPLKLDVEKKRFAREIAMNRRKVLTEFTHRVRAKELDAAVEKAKAVEYRLMAVDSRAKAELKAHEDEAAEFTIRAPHDGVVAPLSLRGMGGMPPMGGMEPPRRKVGDRIPMGGVIFNIRPAEKDKANEDEKPEEKK